MQKIMHRSRSGFTIIELVVVIVVIGILVGISILSYGAWRQSTQVAQVKSELNAGAGAMEVARNFGTGYSTSLPSNYQPGNDVTLTGGSADGGKTYCLDGVLKADPTNATLQYYIDNDTKSQGPKAGTCASRPGTTAPTAPTGVVASSSTGSSVVVTWTASASATAYTAQCASDSVYITGLGQTDVGNVTTATVSGLASSSSFYCRVKATNSIGTSPWSASANTATNSTYGSLAVGTSIEGYWTTVPTGFLLEDGSAVSRTTYSDLFAVVGTTYGAGDGSTTFNLPNSRGRVSVNRNTTDTEFATIGQLTGTKTETLTVAQIPPHQHGIQAEFGTTQSFNSGPPGAYNQLTTNVSYTFQTAYTTLDGGGGQSHNNIQPSIVKRFVIKVVPADTAVPTLPAGSSIDGYWTTAPTGFLLEDGSAISRTTYSDLFAAIGTTYGAGNGSTTFNLPDSRGRVAVNINSSDTEFDSMGEKYGEKQHTLTVAEIPPHQHGIRAEYGTTTSPCCGVPGAYNVLSTNPAYGFQGAYTTLDGGGGGSHNEIQPSITRLAAIKYTAGGVPGDDIKPGTSLDGYWAATPAGFLYEDGSAVSRSTYATLFAIMGTTYGAGDGSTTFNLPDSRGRVAVNLNTSDAEFATVGQKYGTKTVTLTALQIPPHQHGIRAEYGTTSNLNSGPPGQYNQLTTNTAYGFQTAYTRLDGGSGGSHNNIQPSIVKRSVVKY